MPLATSENYVKGAAKLYHLLHPKKNFYALSQESQNFYIEVLKDFVEWENVELKRNFKNET